MSKRESMQKRLQRVRPPRVQLTYDVERGDAIEHKELPFVVGVVGDFAAASEAPQQRLRDRKFVNVDRENFDDVMNSIAPRTVFRVPNRLTHAGGELSVELNFRRFEDFRPESIVEQVRPLQRLMEARTRLAELRNKLAGNEKLEDLLADVLARTDVLTQIGRNEPGSDGEVTE